MNTNWNPQADDEPQHRCETCGTHVHPDMIRVYGDENGDLYACIECSTPRDLRQGAGVDPTYERGPSRGDHHPVFGGEQT